MMMSSRYAPAACVALALALVPTIIHGYVGIVAADTLSTAGIPLALGDYRGTPTGRDEDWGRRRFESHDWFERQYAGGGDSVVLTVLRSYDLKALYHHPELGVAYHEASFSGSRTETFPDRPDMPVHVLTGQSTGPVALYVLHYDGRLIADPIRFQLRTAGELLFTGRRPMTLFFVRDDAVPEGVEPLKLPAARVLASAVAAFVAPASAAK
jgi:hypothetical protein